MNFAGTGFYLAETWDTVRFTACFITDSGDALSYQYLLCCTLTLVEIFIFLYISLVLTISQHHLSFLSLVYLGLAALAPL